MICLELEEITFIDDFSDEFLDVVWLLRVRRNQRVERRLLTIERVTGRPDRGLLAIVHRQEVIKTPKLQKHLHIILERAVSNARLGGVGGRPAELLLGHVFMGDGLHDIRAGHEHVGRVLDHENEIRHRR